MRNIFPIACHTGLLLLVACGGPSFSGTGTGTENDSGTVKVPGTDDSGATASDSDPRLSDSGTDSGDPPDSATIVDSGSVVDSTSADTGPALMCTTPTTPTLNRTQGTFGGIQFHVTEDTVLTSFTVTNSGNDPDTVTLSDSSCNPISSASVPNEPLPGYMPYVVNVNWPLKAGMSYMLTNEMNQTAFDGDNDISFPYSSGILVVEQGLVLCPLSGPDGQVWTEFTNFTFCGGGS